MNAKEYCKQALELLDEALDDNSINNTEWKIIKRIFDDLEEIIDQL